MWFPSLRSPLNEEEALWMRKENEFTSSSEEEERDFTSSLSSITFFFFGMAWATVGPAMSSVTPPSDGCPSTCRGFDRKKMARNTRD